MSNIEKARTIAQQVYQGMQGMVDAPWYPYLGDLWTKEVENSVVSAILAALERKEAKAKASQPKKKQAESSESAKLWEVASVALAKAGDLTKSRKETYFFPMIGDFVDRSIGAWIVNAPERIESDKERELLLGIDVSHDEMMDDDGDESPTKAYVKSLAKELQQHLPPGYWVEPKSSDLFSIFQGKAVDEKAKKPVKKAKKKAASISSMDEYKLAEHFGIKREDFERESDFEAYISLVVLRLPLGNLQSFILSVASGLENQTMRRKYGESKIDEWMENLEDLWDKTQPKRKPKNVYPEVNEAVYLWIRKAMPLLYEHGLLEKGHVSSWDAFQRNVVNGDLGKSEKIKGDFWDALEEKEDW